MARRFPYASDTVKEIRRRISAANAMVPPKGEFLEPDECDRMLDEAGRLMDMRGFSLSSAAAKEAYSDLKFAVRGAVGRIERHNETLGKAEASEVGRIINPVEGRDLDEQQLQAIATDVRSRLVVAGAGTGKTTVIVGLVKYLLAAGKARPEEILALSFTNASVNELRARLLAETGEEVKVSTFHSLGMGIIEAAEGSRPSVSKLEMSRFVSDSLDILSDVPGYLEEAAEFISLSRGERDESSFGSWEERTAWYRRTPLKTQKGESMNLSGEREIADALYFGGISYRFDGPGAGFLLNGRKVRVLYAGTGSDGKPCRWFLKNRPGAEGEYMNELAKRRKSAEAEGCRVIEVTAGERLAGNLRPLLKKRLEATGISFSDIHSDRLEAAVKDPVVRLQLVSRLSSSLILLRDTGKPPEEVYPDGGPPAERLMLMSLRKLLEPMISAYTEYLRREGAVDFSDMLNLAAEEVRSGRYRNPYRWVIVDEYQDLAGPSFRLLKELRASSDYHLFCVGDDWQSIYRFNGSDVGYIMDFENHWGGAEVLRIERTYRFSGELLNASGNFIMRNPRQIPKFLQGGDGNTFLEGLWVRHGGPPFPELSDALGKLPQGASVLLLGRYTFDEKLLEYTGITAGDSGDDAVLFEARPDLKIRFLTVHRSKGLEADYVFVINCRDGLLGFPNLMDDSPLAKFLMAGKDEFPLAEERRLFYVAVTRARKGTFLVVDPKLESPFAIEILASVAAERGEESHLCPKCGAPLTLRESRFGTFWGCSRYPDCTYTLNVERKSPRPRRRGRR
ncbi:UvrD-helicase domain-containing protein [Methanomassiliicoccales archaeon LGM-DZ1]|nr:UvrD-helicase domain-containing protein [Methanomassiliicoccales archaeon LGM-DZ1]